jgi:hypothetical protein
MVENYIWFWFKAGLSVVVVQLTYGHVELAILGSPCSCLEGCWMLSPHITH